MLTKFQEKVYELTKKVPKGNVSTYKAIANALGTKAYRAVGSALSKNTDPRVPCHRIINSDFTIGGFKGKKQNKQKIMLLKKEGIRIKNNKVEKSQVINDLSSF